MRNNRIVASCEMLAVVFNADIARQWDDDGDGDDDVLSGLLHAHRHTRTYRTCGSYGLFIYL